MSHSQGALTWAEFKSEWFNVPNIMTLIRGALCWVPAFVLLESGGAKWLIALLWFVGLALTDKLDGFIAKNFNLQTKTGKVLDPIFDKLLVGLTLVALSFVRELVWVPATIIIVRELAVAGFLEFYRRKGKLVEVIYSGRVKMVVQSVAIGLLFLPLSGGLLTAVWSLVWVSVILTITSGLDYYNAFREAW